MNYNWNFNSWKARDTKSWLHRRQIEKKRRKVNTFIEVRIIENLYAKKNVFSKIFDSVKIRLLNTNTEKTFAWSSYLGRDSLLCFDPGYRLP